MNTENEKTITRVQDAIKIMELAKAADSLYMPNWQTNRGPRIKTAVTVDALHKCGNTACFAGHIATSEEFKNAGGLVEKGSGVPSILAEHTGWHVQGAEAIAYWMGITKQNPAFDYLYNIIYGALICDGEYSQFYSKHWDEVNADDVITKLNTLLEMVRAENPE